MQIEVKGRNCPVTEELRERTERRLTKVAKQVSEHARVEVELYEERNPANPEAYVAEVTLHLKGVTLRAKEATRDMDHSVNLAAEDIARQVKKHREKRRKRREARRAATQPAT